MSNEFTIQVRVYYEDTDAGGIVYHANYLKFCERARSDFIRALGMSQTAMLQSGRGFVVAKMQARFRKPAKFEDLLTVSCQISRMRHVALSFQQEVRAEDGTVLFELSCDVAFIDLKTGELLPLPEDTTAKLKAYCNDEA